MSWTKLNLLCKGIIVKGSFNFPLFVLTEKSMKKCTLFKLKYWSPAPEFEKYNEQILELNNLAGSWIKSSRNEIKLF